MKIISLVPSLTKTVCDLGLKEKVVGITNFCVDPPDLYRQARRIGGTKNPDLKLLEQISPTHVLANEEENRAEDVKFLKQNFHTLVTFPKSPNDVPELLLTMGEFLNIKSNAISYVDEIRSKLELLKNHNYLFEEIGNKFLYLIWRDPWMAAGGDTYISRFLELLGFENALLDDERYPVIDPKKYSSKDVDIIFLSSEPWPFRRRDADYLRQLFGDGCPTLLWIDGKSLSWYGTPTLEAIENAQIPLKNNKIFREI
jgi:iron complex transport system substrate-binding protein